MCNDTKFMQQALKLARFGWGQTAPNPVVGCVIANRHGKLVGTGGRNHQGDRMPKWWL